MKRYKRAVSSELVERDVTCMRWLTVVLDSDLIFSVPKIISFLSQGTTLPAGTIILTG